jgi:hypothetical protein
VLAVDAPARGEHVDEMQSEPACPGTGDTPADRAMAKIRDFDPHHTVYNTRPDVHRRTDGLVCMPDAVSDQFGYEQTGILTQFGVPMRVEPPRDDRACEGRRLRPARHRCSVDFDRARSVV